MRRMFNTLHNKQHKNLLNKQQTTNNKQQTTNNKQHKNLLNKRNNTSIFILWVKYNIRLLLDLTYQTVLCFNTKHQAMFGLLS